ncbi:hypothetical protein R2A130_0904 [Ahrensia sp. R2A130]|nr:hypothetical protein R2A130_0904 [Ahrensia sp. R2A130]
MRSRCPFVTHCYEWEISPSYCERKGMKAPKGELKQGRK